MTMTYLGGCDCGTVSVTFVSPIKIADMTPRACDCNYCKPRNLAYLSHPKGTLRIETREPLHRKKQGSEQANFLTCFFCEEIIAVTYEYDDKCIGALNAHMLYEYDELPASAVTSPKLLPAKEKVRRWQTVWMRVTTERWI